VRAAGIVVPVKLAEEVRRTLRDRGLLLKHLKVVREGDHVFLPVIRPVEVGFPITERDFEEAFVPIPSYKELVRVPADLEALLPSAFDVIGDIVILKIPEPLQQFRREIGEAFLRWSPKLRVVAQDHGVQGEFRVRNLEILAGESRTTTVHTEYGLRYAVDVARAYFSPRLGTERLRIANLVRNDETVLDPFAGVGPYAILIAKRGKPRRVMASDANPLAVRYLKENVGRNRADRVVVREADAKAAMREAGPADRVILDLPHSAKTFLSEAVRATEAGGFIHLYAILEKSDLESARADLVGRIAEEGRSAAEMTIHPVRAFSPTMDHVVFDIKVA
jgi:tRNA (guanine37-N1)-methyltransferase